MPELAGALGLDRVRAKRTADSRDAGAKPEIQSHSTTNARKQIRNDFLLESRSSETATHPSFLDASHFVSGSHSNDTSSVHIAELQHYPNP